MDNYNDRYVMPFSVGSELSAESFRLAQCDNTYMLAASRYYQFYASYIRPRISMYNGWIEGFHNTEYGVIPSLFLQRVGNGIINTLFAKPIVLNTEDNAHTPRGVQLVIDKLSSIGTEVLTKNSPLKAVKVKGWSSLMLK